ncbi:AAA family ATPase [Caminibacter pacificus]
MKKVWRVFVSSTFEDFRLERALLQKFVFPEIKKEAIKKGVEFLPIDLRWGVPQEAQIDQRTMDICLGEVERATTEPHPDFLLLSGDRYGWVPLPRVIEKEEFEKIKNFLVNNRDNKVKQILIKYKEKFVSKEGLIKLSKNLKISQEELEELEREIGKHQCIFDEIEEILKWYEADFNQLIIEKKDKTEEIKKGAYVLKERYGIFKYWDYWSGVENSLKELLQLAVNELDFDEEKKEKYFISATHQEFRTFLNHIGKDNIQNHIFAIMREFEDKDKITDKKLIEDISELKNFKDEIKKNLKNENLKEENICETSVSVEIYKKVDEIEELIEKSENFNKFIEKLNDDEIKKYFIKLKEFLNDKLLQSVQNYDFNELSEEELQEDFLNHLLSKSFIGRDKEIQEIYERIKRGEDILIVGEGGVGKSAFMANLINKAKEDKLNVKYVFVGSTQNSILCEDIVKFIENVEDNSIVFIDAFDQIKFDKNCNINKFFDAIRNKKAQFVISKLNNKQTLNLKNFEKFPLQDISKDEAKDLLKILLKKENRTLTKKQYEYVLSKEDSGKPLYLTMAKEEVKFWRSSDELTEKKEEENKKTRYLPQTQREMIKEFIENLYQLHHNKKEFVKKVFVYIVASDYTLSEEKLLEVLSLDDELMKKVQNTHHKNLTKTIPPAVWARLRFHIKDILIEDENGNLKFFHREFDDIAKEMFFNCETLCQFEKIVAKAIEKGKTQYLIQFLIVSMLKGFKNKRKKECLLNAEIVKTIIKKVQEGNCDFKNELKLFEKKLFKDLRKFFRADADYVIEVEVLFLLNWIKFSCKDEEINKIIDECNKASYSNYIQNRDNLKNIDYSLFEKELNEEKALELVKKSFVSYKFLPESLKSANFEKKAIEKNPLVLLYVSNPRFYKKELSELKNKEEWYVLGGFLEDKYIKQISLSIHPEILEFLGDMDNDNFNNDVLEFRNLYKALKEKYDKEKYIYFLGLYEDLVLNFWVNDIKSLDENTKLFLEIFLGLTKERDIDEIKLTIIKLKKIKKFLLKKGLYNTKTYKRLKILKKLIRKFDMEEFSNEIKLMELETDFLVEPTIENFKKLINFAQEYIDELCYRGNKEKIVSIIKDVYSVLKTKEYDSYIAVLIEKTVKKCEIDIKAIVDIIKEVLEKYGSNDKEELPLYFLTVLIDVYKKYYKKDEYILNYDEEFRKKTESIDNNFSIEDISETDSSIWNPIEIAKKLKKELPKYIYGQDHVIEKIVDNFKNNLLNNIGPRATFLFLGPPATGKTYMAEVLSKLIDGYKFKMFNMEQFTHEDGGITLYGSDFKYSKARPGYLTDFVLKNPESIIVFDEIEKAHPVVQNTLLSIFNNGKMVDKCGWVKIDGKYVPFDGKKADEDDDYPKYPEIQEVDFSKTILIFTSNVGKALYNSEFFWELVKNDYDRAEDMIIEALQKEKSFTPPFLSRLLSGELLLFKKLDFMSLVKVVKNSFESYKQKIYENYNIEFKDIDELIYYFIVLSYAPRIDVRRLKSKAGSSFFDLISDYVVENYVDLSEKKEVKIEISKKVKDYYEKNIVPIIENDDIVKYMFRRNLTLRIEKDIELKNNTFIYKIVNIYFEKVKRVNDFGENGIILDIPQVSFDNIAGHVNAKKRLKEIVRLLKNPKIVQEKGIEIPKGMLLYGPPGTGKTMLAKALANEAGLPFIATTGTDLLNIETIDKIFDTAREYAPSIVFIDEFDAIGNRGKNDGREIVINKLLSKINGFSDSNDVFIIAATNYPEKIDPALLRSGRIDLLVEIKSLDKEARKFFIKKIIESFKTQGDFDLDMLVVYTTGMNGSDLEKVKREVGLLMIRKGYEFLTQELLIEVINTLKYGEKIEVNIEKTLKSTAIHEAGHAVVSKILRPEIAIEQITIVPRKKALGFVAFNDEDGYKKLTKQDIKKQIQILLAGRYSQIKKFNEEGIDTGASDDLEKASFLAFKAITEYGMDEEIKNINIKNLPSYYESTIEKRILEWLKEAEENVKKVIDEHWDIIEKLADYLIEKEYIDGKEFLKFFEKGKK